MDPNAQMNEFLIYLLNQINTTMSLPSWAAKLSPEDQHRLLHHKYRTTHALREEAIKIATLTDNDLAKIQLTMLSSLFEDTK